MPSQSKSQSARTNGAKSHGPVTDAIQREEDLAANHGDDPQTPAKPLTEAFRSLANSPYRFPGIPATSE